jgi:hypothetical protein
MEEVEGLMEKLNLSEAERKSFKLGGDTEWRSSEAPIQAFGELFSERGVRSEVVEQAVGWIWCSLRGIEWGIIVSCSPSTSGQESSEHWIMVRG